MSALKPSERYVIAVENNKMPNRMFLSPNHFASQALPGKPSFSTKRFRRLKKILTPNEFTHFTGGFKGRPLNREGLPKVFGRGIEKKKIKRRRRRAKKLKQEIVYTDVTSLSTRKVSTKKTKKKKKKRNNKKN